MFATVCPTPRSPGTARTRPTISASRTASEISPWSSLRLAVRSSRAKSPPELSSDTDIWSAIGAASSRAPPTRSLSYVQDLPMAPASCALDETALAEQLGRYHAVGRDCALVARDARRIVVDVGS